VSNSFFSFIFGDTNDDSAMSEIQSFRIKYDGEAFSDHTIDVNDLAPALLALGDLMQEANRIANHDTSKISIKVKATETGCFQISIQAIQDIYTNSIAVLAGEKVTALANLTSILWWATAAGGGLFLLIKRLRGKKALKARETDAGEIEIETDSGVVRISKLEWEMYQSPQVRKAVYGILKPLEKSGVEKVDFINSEEKIVTVTKSEAAFYVPPAEQIEPLPEIPPRETYVNVVHMWFRGGNKWKFSEGGKGGNEWSAEIKDQKFIEELLKGQRTIGANDFLKVRVKQTQYREGSTILSEYEILEVLEHKKGYEQMPLT
jgi:hypothetical protein